MLDFFYFWEKMDGNFLGLFLILEIWEDLMWLILLLDKD